MVELQNVSLIYGAPVDTPSVDVPDTQHVNSTDGINPLQLKNIHLSIDRGECVLITGSSGCGKTSLLRLINGLIPHYYPAQVSGCVLLNHQDVSVKELYEFPDFVGTVFQNPRSQFFNVDTTSELAFTAENQGVPVKDIACRMKHTVQNLSIEHLMDRNIFKLSGGEKQQIACGTIDVSDPSLGASKQTFD